MADGLPEDVLCHSCHGSEENNAPPQALGRENKESEEAFVIGAHQNHLKAGTLRKAVPCEECHVVPEDVNDDGHIDPLPAEVTFGQLARHDDTTPEWQRDKATCDDVYCHGATLRGGENKAPNWTITDGSEIACGSCHGNPPAAPHPKGERCYDCHKDTVNADGKIAVNKGKHINGVIDVIEMACNACHGSEKNNAPPVDTNGYTDTAEITIGAHQSHLRSSDWHLQLTCDACHVVPEEVTDPDHIETLPAEITWNALASSDNAAGVFDRASARCSGTYCHGATLMTGGLNIEPKWTVVNGTQAECGNCHGLPPGETHPQAGTLECHLCHGDVIGPQNAFIAPQRHINGTVDVDSEIACTNCHGNELNAAPPVDTLGLSDETLISVGAHQSHLISSNWHRTVLCEDCHKVPSDANDGHDDGVPAEMTFSTLASQDNANPSFNRPQETCTDTYCHGATLMTGGSNIAPKWTVVNGTQAECGNCHGLPPEETHPDSTDCQCCHGAVVNADLDFIAPQRHIDGTVDVANTHPDNYDDPQNHGMDAKLQVADCRECHGDSLTGGCSGVSCDTCHDSGWRQRCTFCHGGTDNQTGAPPEDLRNSNNSNVVYVGSHTAHVVGNNHMTYDCRHCHRKPTDVLSENHMFDNSPAKAEVHFSAGLSANGSYTSPRCDNLYCHGTGRINGDVSNFVGSINECDACHPYLNSSQSLWNQMSGEHGKHLHEGVKCYECHEEVTNSNGQIIGAQLHVNGEKDVRFLGVEYNGGTCNIRCHGEQHNNEEW
ncbi:MAG: CxxxxCH/CxxCH domain-containing protein [Myxococcota bacterium]|nr:CxxxxCH/CxxCH domain-containing protein [Myxococcota bacterium]